MARGGGGKPRGWAVLRWMRVGLLGAYERVGWGVLRNGLCLYQHEVYGYLCAVHRGDKPHADWAFRWSWPCGCCPFIYYYNFILFFGHATRHMGSWFPNQRLNLHPLHWKQSLPLDHQGSFDVGVLVYKVRDKFHKGSIVIVVFIFI